MNGRMMTGSDPQGLVQAADRGRYPHYLYQVAETPLPEQLVESPPPPRFLDLEITTVCQLRCDYCARTFLGITPRHMELSMLRSILARNPQLEWVNLVGLGEPLLHPHLAEILVILQEAGLPVSLVTNGMALSAGMTTLLRDGGVADVTVSIDCADPALFLEARVNGSLADILKNVAGLVRAFSSGPQTVSLFAALRPEIVVDLGNLAEVAHRLRIPAIVVSDLNFAVNEGRSLSAAPDRPTLVEELWRGMRRAASLGVVLLRPNILDEVHPAFDWPRARLTNPEQLFKRRDRRHNCLAPWRTLAVRVDGGVNLCNCTPEYSVGNLAESTTEAIWGNEAFKDFRRQLYFGKVPVACTTCPRL